MTMMNRKSMENEWAALMFYKEQNNII